jgi:hypothetical protein
MRKELLEKVKEIGDRGYSDFQEVSKEWQNALDQIEIDKSFANLKNTKDIINAAKTRIEAIDKKLIEERHLNQEDREYLLGVKDALRTIIYWFNPNDYDEREKKVEEEIIKAYERG